MPCDSIMYKTLLQKDCLVMLILGDKHGLVFTRKISLSYIRVVSLEQGFQNEKKYQEEILK